MIRRSTWMAASLVAFAIVAPASATTLKLDMDLTRDPDNSGLIDQAAGGTVTYGMNRASFFAQTFRAAVTADDGAPVTGCLDAGAKFELVDQVGAVRASSTCADATSPTFAFLPVGDLRVDRPTTLVARLVAPATTTSTGVARALSPASSNAVVMMVRPRFVDEGPGTAPARRFPIKVRLEVPSPRPAAGRIVLQRKSGSRWITVASRAPNVAGRFSQFVALTARKTTFRVVFNPAPNSGWLKTGSTITLTRIG